MDIIYAAREDIPLIVETYKDTFSKSLPVALGDRYLNKMFNWYLDNNERFLFLIKKDERCIGYCGGYLQNNRGEGPVIGSLNEGVLFLLRIILSRPWVLFHPQIIRNYNVVLKLLGKLLTGKRKKSIQKESLKTNSSSQVKRVGLVVIGVAPNYRGQGYAKKLLRKFDHKAHEIGGNLGRLSVKESNNAAIELYKLMDWVPKKHIESSNGIVIMEKSL